MTAAQQILRIMASSGAQSIEALVLETGMSVRKVRFTVNYLRDCGHIGPDPLTYSVTPQGVERAKYEPKVPTKPKPVKVKPAVPPRRKEEDEVSYAMRARPALATVWGSYAA
jgi:hypothetical protein